MIDLRPKLQPSRSPGMSPFMAAIVGFVLGESYTDPAIAEIAVSEAENLVYIRKVDGVGFDGMQSLEDPRRQPRPRRCWPTTALVLSPMAEAQTPGGPVGCRYHQTTEKAHGRIETRKVWCTPTAGRLWQEQQDHDWPGLASVALVEASRTVDGQTSVERRYYISSHPGTAPHAAKHLGHMIRAHWGIENCLHWVLDMAFDEDRSRVRRGQGARNLAVLRKIALNLLRRETGYKLGVPSKRRKAGWDDGYLLKILTGGILDA